MNALKKFFIGAAAIISLCTGCGGGEAKPVETPASNDEPIAKARMISIDIGDRNFDAVLENNLTAAEFFKRLPLELDLHELNGNEKYFRFADRFPVNDFNPKTIRAGDLMIYNGSYFVLFYETFATSFSYTRLGRIENPNGLSEAVGSGDVHVRIIPK